MAKNRHAEIDHAREDALASLQTLRDLPEELQQAHRRYLATYSPGKVES